MARFFEGLTISVGSHLAVSVSGIFFLGTTVAFSLAAYVFTISAKAGSSIFLSVVLALLAAVILGVIFSFFYRRLSADSFVVFTLASVLAFDALLRSWSSLTGGVLGISGVPRPASVSSLADLVILQGVVAVSFVLFEYFILKSPFGRVLQAHKENRTYLNSLGWNSNFIGSAVVVLASFASAMAGILAIWRIQFLDPTFGGGIPLLIEVLTISILAIRPKVRWLVISTLVIILIPEVLRFFPMPSSILGHLRVILYSGLLIILVKRLSAGYTFEKRFV
jgi:branched-chain amino acid transport system permease protein